MYDYLKLLVDLLPVHLPLLIGQLSSVAGMAGQKLRWAGRGAELGKAIHTSPLELVAMVLAGRGGRLADGGHGQ